MESNSIACVFKHGNEVECVWNWDEKDSVKSLAESVELLQLRQIQSTCEKELIEFERDSVRLQL